MATIIKIKNSGTSGSPSAVATGEFAYSYQVGSQANGGDRLYIGTGTETNGAAANIEVVGGKYFTDLLDHVHGTLTASSAVVVDSNSKIDTWNVDNLTMDGNSITSTDTNGDINLSPNGTGNVNVTKDLIVTGDSTMNGNVNLGDNASDTITVLGSMGITGAIDVTGDLDVDNINLNGNTISTTDTNGDLTIAPNGTGEVILNATSAITIPVGTTAQRPTNSTGQIRFNTTDGRFEGYDGNAWAGLGGVVDVDQDTFIRAETSPTTDNDDLEFFTAGTKRATMDSTGLIFDDTAALLQVGAIQIEGTEIRTMSGNSTLTLDPHADGATGTVVIEGNLTVNGNTTTVNSTTVTIDDPVQTLGGDTAPTTNDGLDKGIEFRWYDTAARMGFFGYDTSDSRFKFIPDSTESGGAYTGTVGDVQFGDVKAKSLQFDGTGTGYADHGVLVTDASNAVVYKTSSTDGHVLQVNASGVPFFGHIDCGTY